MAGFRVVVEKAYDFVAKYIILWYIYPSFVGENCGGAIPFNVRFFLCVVYSLQVSDIDDLSADNAVFHIGSEHVDSLDCFDVKKEVIVLINGGSCQRCQ